MTPDRVETPILDRIRADDRDAEVSFGAAQDSFFKKHAFDNDRRQISRCYVLRHSSGRVLGFFTLSMAEVETATLDAKLQRSLPKYPMPVALIGQLAVDDRERGHGYGDLLVQHAFEKIMEASEIVACFGVLVDAQDTSALSFWKRFAMTVLDPEDSFPVRLFLPIKTLTAAGPK